MKMEEKFKCPECGGLTRVIWDPNQESRFIDCIHCRHDVFEPVVVVNGDGEPVMSKNRTDGAGEPVPVTFNEVTQVGCRYKIQRGKGV